MGIVPSGNRKQMESQSYLWNEHDRQADGIIERMLRKSAALGIDPEKAIGDFSSPDQPAASTPETNEISETMNQSNTLPSNEFQDQVMVVNKDGQPRRDQQGEVVRQILEMLHKAQLADAGTYVLTEFDLSNGIQLNAIRQNINVGPAVQKP